MEKLRKNSRKRQAILNALKQTKEHPNAETLYAALKPRYPELSLGTVYRNLALFMADGDVVSVGVVNGQERYDADTSPHAHLICEVCGRVIDAVTPAGIDPCSLAEAEDFEIHSYRLELRGRCEICKRNYNVQEELQK